MVFGDEFVSLMVELFGDVPNNRLTISENVLLINESGDGSISAGNSANSFRISFFESFRLIYEVLFEEIILELFLSDGNASFSGVRAHFVGEQQQLAHGLIIVK